MKKFAKALFGLVVLDYVVGPILIPTIIIAVDQSLRTYNHQDD